MSNQNLRFFYFSLLMLSVGLLTAQATEEAQPLTKVEVSLQNGNVLIGEMIKMDQDSIVIFNEQFGRVAVSKEEVSDYSYLKIDAAQWDKSYYQGQYGLLPSARPVGKGNIYYTNVLLFGNTFSMGFSDVFSLNAGFETVSLFFNSSIPVTYFTPKISLPVTEDIYLGVGTTIFVLPFSGDIAYGGALFSNLTIGSSTNNITVGLAYTYSSEVENQIPLFQGGFTFPLTKKINIQGEILLDQEFVGVYNLGVKVVTKSNLAFDIGLIRQLGSSNQGIGFPLLNFSVPIR